MFNVICIQIYRIYRICPAAPPPPKPSFRRSNFRRFFSDPSGRIPLNYRAVPPWCLVSSLSARQVGFILHPRQPGRPAQSDADALKASQD